MIFLAVASPTPGSCLSSAALALFRSTIAPVTLDTLGAPDFGAAVLPVVVVAAAGAAAPNVTRGVIFLMVAAETPALDKSFTDE